MMLSAVLLFMFVIQGKPPSLDDLQRAARADSNDPVAHYNVAVVLAQKHKWDDAERAVRTAVSIDSHFAPALALLAQVREARTDGASRFLPLAQGNKIVFVRIGPMDSDVVRLRRRAFLLDPLVDLGAPPPQALPTQWRETLGRALREYDDHAWIGADADVQTVIDHTVHPNDSLHVAPVALWFKAKIAVNRGDYATAIRHLEWLAACADADSSARAWNPFADEPLRYVQAYVHQLAGHWDQAVERYQTLVAGDLSLDIAHSHIAEIFEAQERWPEAVQERRRAIDANPDDAALQFELGTTLVSAGAYAEAEATLSQFLQSNPRETRAYYMLGFARMRLGNDQGAREAFTRYVALAPSRYAAQIDDAKRRLVALESRR